MWRKKSPAKLPHKSENTHLSVNLSYENTFYNDKYNILYFMF